MRATRSTGRWRGNEETSLAFQAARALVFEGVAQPNGYTEPLLHGFRRRLKGRGNVDRPPDMVDGFGRRITYVRLSVTDRCDLRCRYCMAETMRFLPQRDILTLEEIVALADIFIARGVTPDPADRRRAAGPPRHRRPGRAARRADRAAASTSSP